MFANRQFKGIEISYIVLARFAFIRFDTGYLKVFQTG